MAPERTPHQVAKRALILATIAFRATLEVTDHPRPSEISKQLLGWLGKVGCDDEIDPIERELLATPLGQLSDSQRTDVNWAGEAATFFCWTLQLVPPLEEARPADQAYLFDVISILKPAAADILRTASLRDRQEIADTARKFVLIRSVLQESRMSPDVRRIIRHANVQRLDEVQVDVTEDAIESASAVVMHMSPEERDRAAGFYFVRDHAALWFLSDRATYFE